MPLGHCCYQIMWFVWKYFVKSLYFKYFFINCLALKDTYDYLLTNLYYECILW